MTHATWGRGRMRAVIYGVIAGMNGAACMSVLRLAARRAGLIDAMPPQVLREALFRGTDAPDPPGGSQLADHALHLAVSAAGGAMYGALFGHRERPSLASGALWGGGLWAASLLVLAPALRARRLRAQTALPQSAVNLAAHLIYGGVLAVMIRDMGEQDRRRQSRGDRDARRVG